MRRGGVRREEIKVKESGERTEGKVMLLKKTTLYCTMFTPRLNLKLQLFRSFTSLFVYFSAFQSKARNTSDWIIKTGV